jgi:Brp/Blh family beta-carotene 15,15'-monooxygenase
MMRALAPYCTPWRVFVGFAWLPALVILGTAFLAPGALVPVANGVAVLSFFAFGLRHGAMDHLVVRYLFGSRTISLLPIVFSYATAVVACGLFFAAAPRTCTVILIACTIVHFGCAEVAFHARGLSLPLAPLDRWPVGAAVAVPLFAHVLAWGVAPALRLPATGIFAVCAAIETRRRWRCESRTSAFDLLIAAATSAVLPAPQAFAVYFGCWHSPRHIFRLVSRVHRQRDITFGTACIENISATAPFALVAMGSVAVVALVGCRIGVGPCGMSDVADSPLVVGAIFSLALPHVIVTGIWDWLDRRTVHKRRALC